VKKTAIVLFNLGGPDKLDSVEPFLFNLFNDKAIIAVPSPIRWLLARFIAKKRAPIARKIYETLGGGSPLVRLTEKQSDALVMLLNSKDQNHEFKAFIAMRYWHPMSLEAAEAVRAFAPDDVVLLPLYPQYSMTTTGSSLTEWQRAAAAAGINVPTHGVCCYPTNMGWISAQADLIGKALETVEGDKQPRILFSAHGLPKKIIAKGDPYQWQVEQTVSAVVKKLEGMGTRTFSSAICYQSRVGPLEWIGPSTEEELKNAGKENVPVVVVPIAFVSEHSETLVELDVEYRELAQTLGVPAYHRVPAVGIHEKFIGGLAALVEAALKQPDDIDLPRGRVDFGNKNRLCPVGQTQCALKSG